MQKLRIAANQRYFETESGQPFIWIADTVWTMPQRMKWDDVDYYMQKRKSQGFTVLQIVALDPERDIQMRSPSGIPALIANDIRQPDERYFQYLDWILDLAEAYGFYVLLLPVWGQLVTGDSWGGGTFETIVDGSNAYFWGQWIGSRYKNRKNILWCLGGDRQPVHKGNDYRNTWRQMAEGLAKGITGLDLGYNQPDPAWRDLLITYHTCYEMETGECSTMSYWTDDEAWISFIMLQSGHGKAIKSYEYVTKAYNREKIMPVWDGEPAYEKMPTSWPVVKDFHGSWSVRKRAYWSLLAGAFGYTYGHASVWCSISEKERSQISDVTWYQALDSEGSAQIKILRDFLESARLYKCRPAPELLAEETNTDQTHVDEYIQSSLCCDKSAAYIYMPSGGSVKINTDLVQVTGLHLWWFNPSTGKFYTSDHQETTKGTPIPSQRAVTITAPTQGKNSDWLAILTSSGVIRPVISSTYYSPEEKAISAKVFDWKD